MSYTQLPTVTSLAYNTPANVEYLEPWLLDTTSSTVCTGTRDRAQLEVGRPDLVKGK